MKQLLILSGKGGTGKTTIASALIKLFNVNAYADCDVDAPNLHLVMDENLNEKKTDYFGLPNADIDQNLCVECGLCKQNCNFNAITSEGGYKVDPFACEGCAVCYTFCPVNAISLKPTVAGELMLYSRKEKVFSTAKLRMGNGTSGMLVTKVKKQMKDAAVNAELAIIDGSPGIGCPVIASLSGVDMVLIVAEPSLSGINDMERIIKTADKFGPQVAVCINKFNTNIENTEKIETYCREKGIPFVGRIPFDSKAVKAINNRETIVDIDCASGTAVKEVYSEIKELIFKGNGVIRL